MFFLRGHTDHFGKTGYFQKRFGAEYDQQITNVNLDSYNWAVTAGKKLGLFEIRNTSFSDIIDLFRHGYPVTFVIDWNTLAGQPGPYQGHDIILSGIKDDKTLFIHDPDNGPFIEYSRIDLEKAYHHPVITDDLTVAYGLK